MSIDFALAIALACALLGILLVINELARRFKFFAIAYFFVLPLALIPLWASVGFEDWFRWVKLVSVILASIMLCLMRYTPIGQKSWTHLGLMLVLGANILEACVQDIGTGAGWNWLNAVAGLANILAMRGWKAIAPDQSKAKDVIWAGLDWPWVVAYTLWNWCFVYFNFPEYALAHGAVLAAPIIMNARKPGTWGQTRAFSLATWMMLEFTFYPFVTGYTWALARPDALAWILGALSLGANLAVLVRVCIHRFKAGQNAT